MICTKQHLKAEFSYYHYYLFLIRPILSLATQVCPVFFFVSLFWHFLFWGITSICSIFTLDFFLPTFWVTSPPRWVHKTCWWGADQMSLICRQQWLAMLSKKAALFTFDTNFSPQAFQDLESQYFFSMEFLEAAHYWPPRVLPVVKQVFSPQATISSSSISAAGQTWNLRYMKAAFPSFLFSLQFCIHLWYGHQLLATQVVVARLEATVIVLMESRPSAVSPRATRL